MERTGRKLKKRKELFLFFILKGESLFYEKIIDCALRTTFHCGLFGRTFAVGLRGR